MRMPERLAGVLAAAALVSCGPAVADRPAQADLPTVAAPITVAAAPAGRPDELDEVAACRAREPVLSALLFTDEELLELERVMKDRLVVVHLGCQEFRLLPSCDAPGRYTYAASPDVNATSRRSTHGGVELQVTSIVVGTHRAGPEPVAIPELEGDCEGATHVARVIDVGAFIVERSTPAQQGVVTAPDAGALQGAAARAQAMQYVGGDLSACRAQRGRTQAPERCRAPLALSLAPLVGPGQPPAAGMAPPGWFSCAKEGQCVEYGSGCGVAWRRTMNAEAQAKDCAQGGGRPEDGPCTRANARGYSSSGPRCGGVVMWMYARDAAKP